MTFFSHTLHIQPVKHNLSQSSIPRISSGWMIHLFVFVSLLCSITASAKNPEDYASSSALASGKWVKVKVSQTGIQTLTAARLKQLGFSDPSKVNVYGYGGRMIADALDENQVDDLPMQPVVRVNGSILFYGVDTNGRKSSTDRNGLRNHLLNAYAQDSYYFLSDKEVSSAEIPREERKPTASRTISSFKQLLVHEKELSLASYMTRTWVGEDFRASTSQSFPFSMPGKFDSQINVIINFVTKTSSESSMTVSVEGKENSASTTRISAVTSNEQFMLTTRKNMEVSHNGDNINLNISFRGGGVISKANLDYIEVYYNRALNLDGNYLCFDITEKNPVNVEVSGISASTTIWDVTNPAYPVEIEYDIIDGKGVFLSPGGIRDYVAFNPVATTLQPSGAGRVGNQDIHSLEVPDMVIITPTDYMDASERLATLHRSQDNMIVHVLTPESLYNEFSSGVRDLSAFRKAMKMWYDRGEVDGHKLKYCILMGRTSNDTRSLNATADGVSYPVMLTWQNFPDGQESGEAETSAYCTDDYIGMLDDSTPSTFSMTSEKVRVAIGRFPVKNALEANNSVEKLEKYLLQPRYGNWRNRFLIVSDNADGGDHLEQGEDTYSAALKTSDGKSLKFERLYFDEYPVQFTASGKEYTQPRNIFYDLLDQGVMFLEYLGHGNTRGWSHERFMLWDDLTTLKNKHLPVIFAATCEFGRWDDTSVCGAENMWLNTNGGAIAFYGTTRKVFIDQNGRLVRSLVDGMFSRDSNNRVKRIGDCFVDAKNNLNVASTQRWRYNIIGDPAIRLLFPENRIAIDEISGVDKDANGRPVVPARSKFTVTGHIEDINGAPLNDFNGQLEITLMDSEKVIETLGNPGESGNDGKVSVFNDHKTILYSGKTNVSNGTFTLQVAMPSEIDNVYNNALISMYAYSDTGIEANGSYNDFYVFGYSDDADDDNEGPVIERFTLNSDNFQNGDVTHDSPVVYASFSDPSGINLSQGGIGHKLTLVLDDNIVYDNLTNAYTPDPDDYSRGSLAFILSSIEPGEHKLKLTVWDNANNSSSATLDFKVAVNRAPALYDVKAFTDKATSSVTFVLTHDRPETNITSTVEVFDLNGRKIWTGTSTAVSDLNSGVQINWDLKDKSGERVPRGIYIYRASIVTPEGTQATKSKKMAVAAE